jgi:hypothetical protein
VQRSLSVTPAKKDDAGVRCLGAVRRLSPHTVVDPDERQPELVRS